MAFFEMHYYSKALQQQVCLNVLLPEVAKTRPEAGVPEGTYKTLYLFHGLSQDHTGWLRHSCVERLAQKYGIAVVMPNVGRSWYTDMAAGAPYFTFVTQELPQVCRGYFQGMSHRREDTLVAGLSMGGYGAIKAALSCPEVYGGCASLSGALDITRKNRPYRLEEWRAIFGFQLESAAQLEGSCHDLFYLARRNAAQGLPFPKLYIWCGTEDTLLQTNRDYRDLLLELGVPHVYQESEGNHSWPWWDLHIKDALSCLLDGPPTEL